MIALGILLAIALLIAVAAGVAHLAFRRTHSRWAQVGVFLLVLWLPFWNVIPGWTAYHNAVREIGGRRIYQVVQAEGYLNLHSTDRARPWLGLKGSPFRYIEIERTHPSWDTFRALEQRPGFYEYRLFKRGAPECRETATIANIDKLFDSFGLRGLCVSSTWRPTPISRYQWESRGWEPLAGQPWPGDVYVFWQRLTDRYAGKVIAESYQFQYRPWFWPLLSPQHTHDEAGKPLTFGPEDVVAVPKNSLEVDPDA